MEKAATIPNTDVAKFPESQRMTKTNTHKFNAQDNKKYLWESGLIGTAKILTYLKAIENVVRLKKCSRNLG